MESRTSQGPLVVTKNMRRLISRCISLSNDRGSPQIYKTEDVKLWNRIYIDIDIDFFPLFLEKILIDATRF